MSEKVSEYQCVGKRDWLDATLRKRFRKLDKEIDDGKVLTIRHAFTYVSSGSRNESTKDKVGVTFEYLREDDEETHLGSAFNRTLVEGFSEQKLIEGDDGEKYTIVEATEKGWDVYVVIRYILHTDRGSHYPRLIKATVNREDLE